MTHTIGLLHPGDMGAFIGACLRHNGHHVLWASEGRSPATAARALQAGLTAALSLADLVADSAVIVSVCPPDAAEDVAQRVVAHGFRGLYVDANAIAPQRAAAISASLHAAGAAFVDGSILGGPSWDQGQTDLYLSGPRAADAAALFAGPRLAARVLGPDAGQASALKMCYAAYTKGTSALLGAILAAADALDVTQPLLDQWTQDDANFPARTQQRVRRVTAKAWRFAGEMDEIAATFQAAGLPGGFHASAAELFRRLSHFKDADTLPELEDVLKALRKA
jgi:3-hydroxyisobutyrate dehydrogenase-like beta-hydroxyacid dehydrogenase